MSEGEGRFSALVSLLSQRQVRFVLMGVAGGP